VAASGNADSAHVTNIESGEHCPVCLTGRFVKRMEEVDFLQWTDKGPVRCQVTILVAACQQCDYKTWGTEAEALMQAAVKKRYDELT
jgi:C4-type Zn-finger protein